jgi:hypothetical protein
MSNVVKLPTPAKSLSTSARLYPPVVARHHLATAMALDYDPSLFQIEEDGGGKSERELRLRLSAV